MGASFLIYRYLVPAPYQMEDDGATWTGGYSDGAFPVGLTVTGRIHQLVSSITSLIFESDIQLRT